MPKRILRFPRLKNSLTKTERFEIMVKMGIPPRGYDGKLTDKQMAIIRRVASGESVRKACDKLHIETDTFYRWRRCHKLFARKLVRLTQSHLEKLDDTLDGALVRSARVVEENLDNEDPYLRGHTAHAVLKGRGVFKSSVQTKADVHVDGIVQHDHDVTMKLPPGLQQAFMEAILRVAVTGGSVSKVLPESELPVIDILAEEAPKLLPASAEG
jgi:transposase-like protein